MTDKANANEDVRALFLGTMPERHDDVARLLEPEGGIAEEMECDRFAIDFLLAGSDAYAKQNNYPSLDVRRKRAMGLFIGLAVVFESTERSLCVPSESHPPAHVRISQLADIVDSGIPGPADPLWVFA